MKNDTSEVVIPSQVIENSVFGYSKMFVENKRAIIYLIFLNKIYKKSAR